MVEEGVTFAKAAAEGRAPTLMDMWEDTVPWGQMALTALKVRRGFIYVDSRGGGGVQVFAPLFSLALKLIGTPGLARSTHLPFQTLFDFPCSTIPWPQSYQYFKAGAQYIVRDGAVVIVDESTGRVKPISRYQVGRAPSIVFTSLLLIKGAGKCLKLREAWPGAANVCNKAGGCRRIACAGAAVHRLAPPYTCGHAVTSNAVTPHAPRSAEPRPRPERFNKAPTPAPLHGCTRLPLPPSGGHPPGD